MTYKDWLKVYFKDKKIIEMHTTVDFYLNDFAEYLDEKLASRPTRRAPGRGDSPDPDDLPFGGWMPNEADLPD